jgi:hypothetical protein
MTELNKLKKQDLIAMIEVLEAKVKQLELDIEHLKARQSGVIGAGATRNPYVK